jgi:hypothetical protein
MIIVKLSRAILVLFLFEHFLAYNCCFLIKLLRGFLTSLNQQTLALEHQKFQNILNSALKQVSEAKSSIQPSFGGYFYEFIYFNYKEKQCSVTLTLVVFECNQDILNC